MHTTSKIAKHLFLDANILLEIILQRQYVSSYCREILKDTEVLYISGLSTHLVYLIGQKMGADILTIDRFLKSLVLLPVGQAQWTLAKQIRADKDMEDALQIACCISYEIPQIFTFDKKMIKKYQNLISFV